MDVRQLRYFVAVATAGSFHAAARTCGVRQPSLSQQIQRLEDDLGRALFDRLGRSVVLTAAGVALLPRARSILADLAAARRQILEDDEDGRGRLGVGAVPTVASFVMPGALATLRHRRPGVEVHFEEGERDDLVARLTDGDLDAAVLTLPVEDDRIRIETIAAEPLVIALPAPHPAALRPDLAAADLAALGTDLIMPDTRDGLGVPVHAFAETHRLRSRLHCRSTQLTTLREFVRSGLGWALVPTMAALADDGDAIAYRPFRGTPPRRTIAVAWHAGRVRTEPARELVDCVRTAVRRALDPPAGPTTDDDAAPTAASVLAGGP